MITIMRENLLGLSEALKIHPLVLLCVPAVLIAAGILVIRLVLKKNKTQDEADTEALLIRELEAHPGKAALLRVLKLNSGTGLFAAFLAALTHGSLRETFLQWISGEGEEKALRALAFSCRGERFSGKDAFFLLKNHESFIRELTGEMEWGPRYFAYRVLLGDSGDRGERSLEDGFSDSHPLIRRILAEGVTFKDREKTYLLLWKALSGDPVYEVRESAKKRILKDFADLYRPQERSVSVLEKRHLLEHLDPSSPEDRTSAMEALEKEGPELRYPAAVFLEKCGVLDELLNKTTLNDPGALERTAALLGRAMEVHVSGFLEGLNGTGGTSQAGARLLVAARLLSRPPGGGSPGGGGPRGGAENVTRLCREVFAFFAGRKMENSLREIYATTLELAASRGNREALDMVKHELLRRGKEKDFLELLLPRLSSEAGDIFLPPLFLFVRETGFPAGEELVDALCRFSPDLLLPSIFEILNDPSALSCFAGEAALRVLGRLKLPYCLSKILESLPSLPPETRKEFSPLLAEYPAKLFEEKVSELLGGPDSHIRASLLAVLPAAQNMSFMKDVRSSLKDPDPDVRIAAVRALLEYGELRLLNQETSMLRDPIERVRIATADVIARSGNQAAMEILQAVIDDPNETETVKLSVIAGLGASSSPGGLSILAGLLEAGGDFQHETKAALIKRNSKKDIVQLVEIFKDASGDLRGKLIPVFKDQGKDAEAAILELLAEGVATVTPYLARMLEETGCIEETVRRLSHRDVRVRREAARKLSLMGSLPAFRGLVMAAKDPDQEVRVSVVRALEKLKTAEGREILESLKDDPDNRIRKYTHWAIERLDSLAME
ncbi:MAG: HEAT repeat domain-containing protein [Treponema sp.]|jgi:hypothetical protein|nr:HEAT repeat domain-containing protein [Treponema sp.]